MDQNEEELVYFFICHKEAIFLSVFFHLLLIHSDLNKIILRNANLSFLYICPPSKKCHIKTENKIFLGVGLKLEDVFATS